ncbi:hypothetical protein KY328_03540 [Candidatus Woesearchaeota archaeon]|nr:hypothetical protein [Candidatus Woesearchaeota archaeon]MBW3021968.1 hypothetical protein [Candidatus Woesearchaeota archaeon]
MPELIKPKYEKLKGVVLDAGGVLFDVGSIDTTYRALVRHVSDFFYSKGYGKVTSVVNLLIAEGKKLSYLLPQVGLERLVFAVVDTIDRNWGRVHSFDEIKRMRMLCSELEIILKQAGPVNLPESVLGYVQRAQEYYDSLEIPPVYEHTKNFLEYLSKSGLDFVVVTDAPRAPEEIRSALKRIGIPPEKVIPSMETKALKERSDLPYIAAILLLHGGPEYYRKKILPFVELFYDRKIFDKRTIVQATGIDIDLLDACFKKTAGFFNNPIEHERATLLDMHSYYVDTWEGEDKELAYGKYKIKSIKEAPKKLEELEGSL